ncbi:hypothetical protein CARUB_v10027982mg [Capsella rubella]|uniref:F-box domain-containing protein n=1 Tax=Capsella rubella TaxID=81985 RepID=R0GQR9_9BRAS|nr:F-box protein At1g30790 [Capsella rubella]EOA14705.1 hypothetical protein CARUB_v10027982mg [Capsella rubella]
MKEKDQELDKDGSNKGPGHLELTSFDITVEILTRLPVKSLMKFQYVSKTWCSIIRSKNFINSLVSTPSPLFLISLMTNEKAEKYLFLLTSLQEKDEESTSLVANLDMTLASNNANNFSVRCASVNGFISLSPNGRFVVCNPSTKQVILLPKFETAGTKWGPVYKFLGYDPINDQYKALCKKMFSYPDEDQGHMVLTLGGDKTHTWRQIEGAPQNYLPRSEGICINGFVYYRAWTPDSSRLLVCFDVRLEKLSIIKLKISCWDDSTSALINYKGELAHVVIGGCFLDFWVLIDAKEHKWSNKFHQIYRVWWDSIPVDVPITIHGTNNVGEIIISPKFLLCNLGDFPIIYYDIEKKKVTKVQLKGIACDEDFRRRYGPCLVNISPEHCCNFNLI